MTYEETVAHVLHNLAKPPGSLGLLEDHAKKTLLAWGKLEETFSPKHIIFAADNGVVRSGVVAQLADITYMQSKHMVDGTSAVTCFCRCNGIPYEVVDVGIDSPDSVGVHRKIARGTKDFAKEPAMSLLEYKAALAIGAERVHLAKRAGHNFLSFGEMGIGNTTTSAAVLSAIAPKGSTFLVGYGSAAKNYKLLLHKRAVVEEALNRYGNNIHSAADALRYVGGFDLVALCGAMMACADQHMPFYIDGFITAVALACAVQLKPAVAAVALPSHVSRESGMAVALRICGIDEYDVPIHGNMSLGEGTGAVLATVLLRSMLYAVWHMDTLDGINQAAALRHEQRKDET